MSVSRIGMVGKVWFDDTMADVMDANSERIVVRLPDGREKAFEATEPLEVRDQLDPGETWLGNGALDKSQTGLASWKFAHLNEALTGYASGDPGAPREGEPRPQYDPSISEAKRMETKATEIGVDARTLRNWKKKLPEGAAAFIDGRSMKSKTGVELPEDVKAAVAEVAKEYATASDITNDQFWFQVVKKMGGTKLPDQSLATLNRYLAQIGVREGLNKKARARREFMESPKDEFGHLAVDRPGEVIVIDTTTVDLHALDPVSLEWVRLDLTIAMDLYTRSIVSFRFSPVSTKGVDLALLLADIVSPNPVDDRWPTDMPYPYCGVPETVILREFELPKGTPLKPRPTVKPETILVDHGRNYQSFAFTMGCAQLGTGIQSARPRKPTDKGFVERIFGTANDQLFQGIPGYTGPNVQSRGQKPEDKAVFFIWELERIFGKWVAEIYQNTPHDGLRPVECPRLSLTPNEAYEDGIARCGFVKVANDPNLNLALLPVEFKQIRNDGISHLGLDFDSAALNEFRYRPSPHPKKKWPFRVDPRDLRRVWFENPYMNEWHEIPWRFGRDVQRPLSSEALAHVKRVLADGKKRPTQKELRQALLRFHLELEDEVLAREDRLVRREVMRATSTERQVRALPAPRPNLPEIPELVESEWTTEITDLDIRHD